jgi:hypothetical protein
MACLGEPIPLAYAAPFGAVIDSLLTRAITGSITIDNVDLVLPSGYCVINTHSWSKGTNNISAHVNIYVDEPAYVAGANPVSFRSQLFDYNNIGKTGDFHDNLYTALLDVALFANCTSL